MTLTRRTLLKHASLGALALAFGKLPEMPAEGVMTPIESAPVLSATKLPGWLPLDGRTIKASEYPELHTALRDVYWPGVPGPTGDIEFAVPDLRASALGAYMSDPLASPHIATAGPYAGEIHWKIKTDEAA